MIVLDTHAWIWWASDPARLGRRARAALEAADRVGVPAVCCFEVAAAAARGSRVPHRKQASSAARMVVPQFAQSTSRSPSHRGQNCAPAPWWISASAWSWVSAAR